MASSATGTALGHIHQLFSTGNVAGLSDDQLLERFAAQRDEAAFAALVARHGPDGPERLPGRAEGRARRRGRLPGDLPDRWPARPARSGPARRSAAGSTGWLTATPSGPVPGPSGGAGASETAMALAAARTQGDASPWGDDWLPVLHEEIDRLPERAARPIVLCYLQELTYEQAAQRAPLDGADAPLPAGEGARAAPRPVDRAVAWARPGQARPWPPGSTRRPASAGVPSAWAHAAVRAATGGATASIRRRP